ncbi:hypothetical protein P7K49_039914 [Saguinus oedipus]|uniref:Uncharacterized protein n=1 Tax=Saguinus oedipus TaxID=9490 RepID=A0ABQ9TCF0_SAGOE|nr:hypothetical protein P7K49_039914 [Saguinus oedipus]
MQVGSCCLPVGAGTLYMAPKLRGLHSPGYGWLSLSIEGSSKVDINTEDLEDGMSRVTYCPTEPGNYIINNKYADQHVPGECSSALAAPLTTSGPRGRLGEREHHMQVLGSFSGQHLQSL